MLKILIIFSVISACTLFLSGCNNLPDKAKTVGDDFAENLYRKRIDENYNLYQWLAITRGAKTPQEIDTFVNTAIQETKSQWRQQDAAIKELSSHVHPYP